MGSNGQLLSMCPHHQRRTELLRSRLHDAKSRGQQHGEVRASCQGRQRGSQTRSGSPGKKESGAAGKGTRPSCRGGMPQVVKSNCVGDMSDGLSLISSLPGRAVRWGGKSGLGLLASLLQY